MNIKPQTGKRNYAKGGAVKGYADGGGVFAPEYLDRQGALQGGERIDPSRPSDMSEGLWMSLDSTAALKREEQQRQNEARNPAKKGLHR
jgi:hypothetical protein